MLHLTLDVKQCVVQNRWVGYRTVRTIMLSEDYISHLETKQPRDFLEFLECLNVSCIKLVIPAAISKCEEEEVKNIQRRKLSAL